MFTASSSSSQANGTSDAAGVDLGSSPSWRCARARDAMAGVSNAPKNGKNSRRVVEREWGEDARGGGMDWNNFHPSCARVEARAVTA